MQFEVYWSHRLRMVFFNVHCPSFKVIRISASVIGCELCPFLVLSSDLDDCRLCGQSHSCFKQASSHTATQSQLPRAHCEADVELLPASQK